ncbi:MAG: response regulator transcription factor [Anaerolineaceae bacterium]|nr:response regulator transcription factor [Anaerolineaceae bacterium]
MDNCKIIKILLAEDQESLRKYYVHILEQDPNIEVVADVSDGPTAIRKALALKPDVILMDIEMDTKDAGLLAVQSILSVLPDTKIIILTVYEEDKLVSSAFVMGVCDYMLKNSTPDELRQAVKDAYIGQSPIRPDIAPKIRSELQRSELYKSSFMYALNLLKNLTSTEIDILYLLSLKYSRADICKFRCVEMSTVKTQIHNLLKKMNKKSTQEVLSQIQDQDIWNLILNVQNNQELN